VILGIHHAQIVIPVGAEDRARAFYCGVLGLVEVPKPEVLRVRGGLWLQVGDRQLHVAAADEPPQKRAHVAYEVDDLDAWRARLVAAGIAIVDGEEIPGWRRFELRDPFGNRVELLARAR
jgi:catechol 2,3-dioxygenase-like lactoylglutathione lyase family enzyme